MCFQDDLYARKDRIKKAEYGAPESQEKKHILILPQISSMFNPKLTCIYSQVQYILIPFFIKMSFKRLGCSPGYDFPPSGNLFGSQRLSIKPNLFSSNISAALC